jgi:hypothetical protein
VRVLDNLRAAVELERRELERLHKIDVAATALDQLVQDHARESERLEADIKARRSAWEEEARTTERERKRENDEYEYRKQLTRKKEKDEYEEEQRQLERRNKERQEKLEKDWAAREAALKEREQDYARLLRESAEFNDRLRQATEQAGREAAQATEARLSQQLVMLERDREADKRLAELQIRTLEATIGRQNDQLAALQKQLDEAKVQVQEIAVRAIEGASGAKALSHVNQIAIEQAKHRPQS